MSTNVKGHVARGAVVFCLVGLGCGVGWGARVSLEATGMEQPATANSDRDILLELNRDYIDAVQQSDVDRFEEILGEDFRASNPDGSLVDKAGFLRQTAQPVTITNLEDHDVEVRIMGDFAIIHARTSYTGADGRVLSGRYTDVWARRDGRWLAVAAHVTRGA